MRRASPNESVRATVAPTLVAAALLLHAIIAEEAAATPSGIVLDAEFCVLQAQHGEQCAAEDKALDQKLPELGTKYRRPANITHETDLFTTLAQLAGATQYIPADRVIDGVDQTELLINGDTHSRCDCVFIYAGPRLDPTVKGDYKRLWVAPDSVDEASGIPAAFCFLPSDPREKTPMLVNLIPPERPFNRMRLRHELWKKKYPDSSRAHGIPGTGLAKPIAGDPGPHGAAARPLEAAVRTIGIRGTPRRAALRFGCGARPGPAAAILAELRPNQPLEAYPHACT